VRASTIRNENIPKPVKCIAVASPFVGALDYRQSVEKAESLGLLKLLRVSGQGDIINCLPFLSLSFRKLEKIFMGPLLPFKHVGLNLKLDKIQPGMGYKIMYPKSSNRVDRYKETCLLTNLDAPENILNNHMDYTDRVESLRGDSYLSSVTLDELYQDNVG